MSATGQTAILRVYHYDSGTKSIRQKSTIQMPDNKDISEIDLSFIRSLLVQAKIFDSPDVSAPFCNTVGAKMKDNMTFKVYLQQIQNEDDETPADDEDEEPAGDKDEADLEKKAGVDLKTWDKKSLVRPIKKSKKTIEKAADFKVYYKKRKKLAEVMNSAETDFLKKQLDLKLQEAPELKDKRAKLLSSAFDSSKWKAEAASSGEKLSIAANLSERDWSVITRVNCLLSGHQMTFDNMEVTESEGNGPKDPKKTKILRLPSAFKLKARIFDEYEVVAPAGQGAIPFHIPRYRVDDASYVEVVETQNVVKSSLAKSSFSNNSLEASVSGGFWGVSAAAKAGYAQSDAEKSLNANTTDHHKVHITYNFPRVTVILDTDSLQPTDDMKEAIAKVSNKDALNAFSEKYGDIFARRVKLGGKLTSTSDIKSTTTSTESSREKALKISAAASFSAAVASGSAEGSFATGSKNKTGTEDQKFNSNLNWEATGGDTTLCNDPPNWCSTVGNYYNWRIVELDDVVPLPTFLSSFPGFEHTERRFEIAAGFQKVTSGLHIYTKIRLVETKTGELLRASSNSNPLKTAVEKIAAAGQGTSPSFSTPTDDLLSQLSKGGVSIEKHEKDDSSVWVLARWVEKDQGRVYSYGDRTYLFNTSMPEGANYLGATTSIAKTQGSGFLYPTTESEKAWFTLSPAGKNPHSSGFLENNDTVEIRVRDKSGSADLGVLMQSSYAAGSGGDDTEIDKEIRKVPGIAPRMRKEGKNKSDQVLQPNDDRILQFRVEIVESSTEL
ncbi:hypothetical protein N7492_004762 [Penicillium capsulatum]|uniref:MACPF-like domain-containing protein n=1 Tax=Penicillium capsulatum TaxID=69766 RepID=A0A9W9I895_9EURO|nr:hypothetical protein N7492_004762 [Penicillium capsulatum]KAJ6136130.1 hypothetical protein N7512_001290 [Penicillium capsulatum]